MQEFPFSRIFPDRKWWPRNWKWRRLLGVDWVPRDKNSLWKKGGSSNACPVPEDTIWGLYYIYAEMCSERDSPLEPFVLLAPGQPELARLICGAHLGPPVLTRKQKRPRVNSLVYDRVAAFSVAGPPEVLSRMSRPVTQTAERERELARACSQRLKQAAPSLPGESVSRGFADRGDLEGYPSHYTSLIYGMLKICIFPVSLLWTCC